ncbi:MAG: heavy metal-binding domain-containing protein, partial [Pseudomonadota bacterium]
MDGAAAELEETVVRDPVCGMLVDPASDKPSAVRGAREIRFCCDACREKFEAAPERWLTAEDPVTGETVDRASTPHMAKHAGARFFFEGAESLAAFEAEPERWVAPAAPPPAGVRYVCPMCPEAVSDVPADCPYCGMALEPEAPSLDDGPNPEFVDFRRRLVFGAPLAGAVFALEMGSHLGLPVADWIGPRLAQWLQFALAAPVVLWLGAPFFKRGWSSLKTGAYNMWTLIAIGVGAAFAFSVVATLAPGLFPESVLDVHGRAPIYFEAAAVIIVLVLVGQVMELSARERTGDAIRALLRLSPKTALRLRDGEEAEVDLAEIVAVDRDRLPRPHAEPVADDDFSQVDLVLDAVLKAERRLRRKAQQRSDRVAGALASRKLHHLPDENEHDDDR